MKIHIIQHAPFEGLGALAPWARHARHTVQVTKVYDGERLPGVDEQEMLVLLGGPMSVNDEAELPWLAGEKRFVEAAMESGSLVLGLCLGAQLIADVLGAKVYRNTERELGWFPVRHVQRSFLTEHLPPQLEAFHWHGETFDLPRGAIHLLRSEACANQAFQYGENVLALQFHLEMEPEGVRALVSNCPGDLKPGNYVQSESEMLRDAARFVHAHDTLAALLSRFTGDIAAVSAGGGGE